LSLARGFRGDNAGMRGDLSRVAYAGITMSPVLAEACYLLTNIGRIIPQFEDIILISGQSKASGIILLFLGALEMLEFKGKVFIQDGSNVQNALTPSRDMRYCYRYGSADFTVVLTSTPALYATRDSYLYKNKDSVLPSVKSLVIDWRDSHVVEYNRTNFQLRDTELRRAFESFYNEWENFSYPVLSRTSMFNDLVNEQWNNVQIISCVELHNLVVWTCYKFKCEVGWWYDINDGEVFSECCAASIACNIVRCMRYVYGFNPGLLLEKLGYKRPVVKLSALGKQNVAMVVWQDAELRDAASAGPVALLKYFNDAPSSMQAMMMVNPVVSKIISESGGITVAQEKVDVHEKDNLLLNLSLEDNLNVD